MTHRPEDYALNHWLPHESDAEHALRVESAEEHANDLFRQATVDQSATYHSVLADIRHLSGPRYDRAREAAKRVWRESTQEARNLFNSTADALMATGEVSEELDREWTRLISPARATECWPDDLAAEVARVALEVA